MHHLPRSLSLAGRLSFIVVWLVGLLGPLPAAPALAALPAQASVSVPAGFGPANDDFANATPITLPPSFTASIDLSAATGQADEGEPFDYCTDYDAPTVWYRFTPPTSGFYVFLTEGSTITHAVSIYTSDSGSLGDLNLYACDESDILPSDGVSLSGLLFTAGETYYIQVSALTGAVQAQGAQAAGDVLLTVLAAGSVTGTVWNDLDGNGVQDGGEPGLPGATVTVVEDDTNIPFTSVTTDSDGNYRFNSLPISATEFTFYLAFTPPAPGSLLLTTADVGSDATDSDADPATGTTISFTLDSLVELDFDAGFGAPVQIAGTVWRDLNSNDVQDPGEPGLADVPVCLQSADSSNPSDPCWDYLDLTDLTGAYSFFAPPGDYSLHFDPADSLTAYARAAEDVGSDATDSDPDDADGIVPTFTTGVNDVLDFDAGYQTTGFGGRVWRDFNEDGLQDPGEPGVESVYIALSDSGGFVSDDFTDTFGQYDFIDLAPGVYTASIQLPTNNTASPQNVGGDDTLDSDGSVSVNPTFQVTVTAGQLDLTNDQGLIKPVFIVDNLSEYHDANPGDGLCEDDTSVVNPPLGLCSLRAAIEEANYDLDYDVIQFDATVFSATQTISQISAYTVTSSLWVDGPGSELVVLDGNDVTRIVWIDTTPDRQVTLSGLHLTNGYADVGGAIYSPVQLTLIDVIIDSSSADIHGGALYNEGSGRVESTLSTFRNNGASNGGAIYNVGTFSATTLLLEGNEASSGGGLYNSGGLVLLATSVISGNEATDDDGGGVFNTGSFSAADTAIQNNRAVWDGGGIATELPLSVAGSATPQVCAASQSPAGCGVFFDPGVTLTVNSLVAYNLAGYPDQEPSYGGGIYHGAGTLLIDASQVNVNTVYGYGGGIYNEGAGVIFQQSAADVEFCFICGAQATLQNGSELSYNAAVSTTVITEDLPPMTYTYPSQGGGLFNLGLAFIDDSQVLGNSANTGGGFYNASGTCFCPIVSGPSVFAQPSLFVSGGSTVGSNHAILEGDFFDLSYVAGVGGGGFNGGHAEITASSVVTNLADLWGGGLFNSIEFNSIFQVAEQGPAGIGFSTFDQLALLTLADSLVAGNVADAVDDPSSNTYGLGMGGGLFNFLGRVDADSSTFDQNTAGLWGGGIANGCLLCFTGFASSQAAEATPQGPGLEFILAFSQLDLHGGSVVSQNQVNPQGGRTMPLDGGGGVFNSGLAVIASSTITRNIAFSGDNSEEGLGGGLYNIGIATLDDTQVVQNVAESDGGGIANDFFSGVGAQGSVQGLPDYYVLFVIPILPTLSFEAPLVVRNDSGINENQANPAFGRSDNGFGGGLFTYSPALIDDSTISGNWAALAGGGVSVDRYFLFAQAQQPQCLQGGRGPDPMFSVRVRNDSLVSQNLAGQLDGDTYPDGIGGGFYVGGYCETPPLLVTDSLIDANAATNGGGGVYVDGGWAELHNTNLTNNDGNSDNDGSGNGGATYNFDGYLLIDPANIIGNSANFGGGSFTNSGETFITQTTYATNTAIFDGGGLYIGETKAPAPYLTVANSTFSANQAGNQGGGVYQEGDNTTLHMYNNTIANNDLLPGQAVAGGSLPAGAGFYKTGGGAANINNTLIYGNGAGVDDCTLAGPLLGVANMGDATCSGIPGWTTANPLLGPLQYNSGPNGILTHALGSLSPAIDQADTTICGDYPVNGVDERNVLRLLDLACDIGAYEFESLTYIGLTAFTGSAQGDVVTLAWETAVEVDTAGYNLYRAAAPDGPYVQINALLIGAQGPSTYTYPDMPGAGTWYYQLEDVDTSNNGTLHGPVAVTVGNGTGATTVIYLPVIGIR